MELNAKGYLLIRSFEGLRLTAYLCPAGVPTIGYGSTGPHVTQEDARRGRTISRDEAEALLRRDLEPIVAKVEALVGGRAGANEFAAMVCLAFNIGVGAFAKSSVLKRHNGGDKAGAAQAFGMWNKAAGTVLAGLVRRRAAEATLYLSPDDDMAAEPMPQAVTVAVKPLGQSRTLAGAATVAVGGLAEAARQFDPTLPLILHLKDYAPWAVAALVLVGAALVVYARIDDWRKAAQ